MEFSGPKPGECVACSRKLKAVALSKFRVCERCGGLHNYASSPVPREMLDGRRLSGKIRLPNIAGGLTSGEGSRYFDLTIRYSDGRVDRVHGWYNDATGNWTQVG